VLSIATRASNLLMLLKKQLRAKISGETREGEDLSGRGGNRPSTPLL